MDDLISKTLRQAQGPMRGVHGALEAMLRRELTPDMELPPMEFLMRLFGEPCFPRRELVAITGRAKFGKTFVMSIIMLMCLIKQALRFERDGEEPLKVMWFDTEQSDQSTLGIIQNRIMEMFYRKMGPDIPFPKENLRAFNVRFETCETRRKGFQVLVPYVKPDLVILDGIRDLVPDINDGAEAQRIIDEMLSLAQANNCCILAVLHQNKSGESRDPRGWLGTELLNKAFDVFATEKLKLQNGQEARFVFKLEQLYTRKYDIEQQLYFEVDDDGLPFETEAPPMPVYISTSSSSDSSMEERPQLNEDYVIHHADNSWEIDVPKLFVEAFEGNQTMTGSALRYKVKTLANIVTNRLYNNCLDKAMAMNLMAKSKDKLGRVIYELNVVRPEQAGQSGGQASGLTPQNASPRDCPQQTPDLFSQASDDDVAPY